ncbi:hypothetical protein GLYMA_17G079850v4 [Glycine max]|nr:hypothetical protein GLYMA_17G079850v4 [Glycine max]KAH1117385.1 hypothetical protein GYH30_046605 [Glycine max]
MLLFCLSQISWCFTFFVSSEASTNLVKIYNKAASKIFDNLAI